MVKDVWPFISGETFHLSLVGESSFQSVWAISIAIEGFGEEIELSGWWVLWDGSGNQGTSIQRFGRMPSETDRTNAICPAHGHFLKPGYL